jgi:3-methylcrotonyl-CoA carboxylase alpha subunit
VRVPAFAAADAAGAGRGDRIVAPMPGRIVLVKAAPGQVVAEGDELLVMEAMKMELSLKAPRAGSVAAVRATAGDFVDADAVLLTLEIQA